MREERQKKGVDIYKCTPERPAVVYCVPALSSQICTVKSTPKPARPLPHRARHANGYANKKRSDPNGQSAYDKSQRSHRSRWQTDQAGFIATVLPPQKHGHQQRQRAGAHADGIVANSGFTHIRIRSYSVDAHRFDVVHVGKRFLQIGVTLLGDIPLRGLLTVLGVDFVYHVHALCHLAKRGKAHTV